MFIKIRSDFDRSINEIKKLKNVVVIDFESIVKNKREVLSNLNNLIDLQFKNWKNISFLMNVFLVKILVNGKKSKLNDINEISKLSKCHYSILILLCLLLTYYSSKINLPFWYVVLG